MNNKDIEHFKMDDFRKGLLFGITDYKELISSDDIFRPSIRDFHVLFWIKKGTGSYFLDFQNYDFNPNTILLLSKDRLHYFKPFNFNETEIISIGFKPEFIYQTDNDLKHLFTFNTFSYKKKANDQIFLNKDDLSNFDHIFGEIFSLSNSDRIYRHRAIYHYLSLLLIRCEELLEDGIYEETFNSESDKSIQKFNTLLEENFKKHFNVQFYADKLNLTTKALVKLTRDKYNQTPKAIIDDRRILEIKRLLRGTDKSGKMIAMELNFLELTNMYKFFKKHVGFTPGEFKNDVY